jgi:hypothetical protein
MGEKIWYCVRLRCRSCESHIITLDRANAGKALSATGKQIAHPATIKDVVNVLQRRNKRCPRARVEEWCISLKASTKCSLRYGDRYWEETTARAGRVDEHLQSFKPESKHALQSEHYPSKTAVMVRAIHLVQSINRVLLHCINVVD